MNRLKHDLWNHYQHKTCLHPSASKETCSKKIIRAHTISRSSTLSQLLNSNNQVYTFHPIEIKNDELLLRKKGWKKEATIFRGFCSKHDNEIFEPIEKGLSQFNQTSEHCFLIGYRALCHEYYMKLASVNASETANKFINEYGDAVDKYFLNHTDKETLEGFEIVKKIKSMYDLALLSQDFSDFNFLSISFSGSLSIVSTGMITPGFDLKGNKIQDYYDEFLEGLPFGMISNGGRHFFVFHWPKRFKQVTKLIDSVLKIYSSRIPDFLIQYAFANIENVYFSEDWWVRLQPKSKDYINELVLDTTSPSKSFHIKNLNLVNWRNIQIHKRIA